LNRIQNEIELLGYLGRGDLLILDPYGRNQNAGDGSRRNGEDAHIYHKLYQRKTSAVLG